MKKLFLAILCLFLFIQNGFTNPNRIAYKEFKENNYYYLLSDSVRLRTRPDGNIIMYLPLHAKIKILPAPSPNLIPASAQIVNSVSAYWYYIEYEGITGYIWGGYIAANTLICDIDNNGIDDYFHYRVSRIQSSNINYIDSRTDIFIYINNIKKSSTNISYLNSSQNVVYYIWDQIDFRLTEKNTVKLYLSSDRPGYRISRIYEITETGTIKYIETIEGRYELIP